MADIVVDNSVINPPVEAVKPPSEADIRAKTEILSDLLKHKDENLELKKKLQSIEDDKLKATNQFKELYEREKQAKEDAEQKMTRFQASYLAREKHNAVKDASLRLGIRKEALPDLDLVELNDVVVETTSTGKINILGADSFAEKLKTLRPHWFESKSTFNVNTGGSKVVDGSGVITTQQILAAEIEGRKKGDLTQYRELTKQYQQQKAAASLRR